MSKALRALASARSRSAQIGVGGVADDLARGRVQHGERSSGRRRDELAADREERCAPDRRVAQRRRVVGYLGEEVQEEPADGVAVHGGTHDSTGAPSRSSAVKAASSPAMPRSMFSTVVDSGGPSRRRVRRRRRQRDTVAGALGCDEQRRGEAGRPARNEVPILRDEALARAVRTDELHGPEQARAVDARDSRVPVLQLPQTLSQVRAQNGCAIRDSLLEQPLDVRRDRRAHDRIPGECAHRLPPVAVHHLGDLAADDDAARGERGRHHALAEDHQVRRHPRRVLVGEVLPRPPEAGHDLVVDPEDPVLARQLAKLRQVLGRRMEHADAEDRLGNDGRDRVGADGADQMLGRRDARERVVGALALGIGVPDRTVETVGRRCEVHALHRDARRAQNLVGVGRDEDASRAGQSHQGERAVRPAVVGEVSGDHVRSPGDGLRDEERELDRLRPRRREPDPARPVVGSQQVVDDQLRGA